MSITEDISEQAGSQEGGNNIYSTPVTVLLTVVFICSGNLFNAQHSNSLTVHGLTGTQFSHRISFESGQ